MRTHTPLHLFSQELGSARGGLLKGGEAYKNKQEKSSQVSAINLVRSSLLLNGNL